MAEKFNQAEYIKEYQRENRITKKVTFNRKNPDDMEMVEWLDNRPEGIVQYLKRLIRADMKKGGGRMKFRIWIAQTGKASDIYFESTDLEETLKEYRKFVKKYSDRDDIQIKLEGRQPNFK